MIYSRDASIALNFGAGLPFETKAVLSILMDIMAIHGGRGIPCGQPNYIAGLVGVGQRRWTQRIEPALIGAQKIRKTMRNGIEVYVFCGPSGIGQAERRDTDEEDPEPPRRESVAAPVARSPEPATKVQPRAPDIQAASPPPVAAPISTPSRPASRAPIPAAPPTPNMVPAPNAYDLLKRAGVAVDDHPRGVFFWQRVDHAVILHGWLAKCPLDVVLDRLARAQQAGKMPKDANSLTAYESIALGEA